MHILISDAGRLRFRQENWFWAENVDILRYSRIRRPGDHSE